MKCMQNSRDKNVYFYRCLEFHFSIYKLVSVLGSRCIQKEIKIQYSICVCDKILCYQRLTHNVLHLPRWNLRSIFVSLATYLCGIHYFRHCVFRKGLAFFYELTSIPVWIEYSTMIKTVPSRTGSQIPETWTQFSRYKVTLIFYKWWTKRSLWQI